MGGLGALQKRLLLILNPAAGMRKANRFLVDIIALFNSNGYVCTVFCTARQGHATDIARENAHSFDLVVCIGGDGTMNEVMSGLLDSGLDLPIGYIPAGSTNDFAASLGLSKDVLTAAKDIIEGTPKRLDVGSFNGRRFSYVASFGAFTEASYSTPQSSKNMLGHLAYVLEGMKDLPNIRPIHLAVRSKNASFEGDYIFGAISNATSIGGVLSLDKQLVSLDDGLFEITLIKAPLTLNALNRIVVSLQTRQYDPEMIHFFVADKVWIDANPDMPWTLDGEYAAGSASILVENLHQALPLILNQK